jgi:hypothetical protein
MRSKRDEHVERLGRRPYLIVQGPEKKPDRRRARSVGHNEHHSFVAILFCWTNLFDQLLNFGRPKVSAGRRRG